MKNNSKLKSMNRKKYVFIKSFVIYNKYSYEILILVILLKIAKTFPLNTNDMKSIFKIL